MIRNNQLAIKYRLRQAFCAGVTAIQDIMLKLVNDLSGRPKQDQDCEQPGRESFVVQAHIRSHYRTRLRGIRK